MFPLIFFRLDAVATWTLRHVCVGFLKLCEEYFKTFCPSILYNELEYDSDSLQCIGRNRTCIFRALKAFQKLKHLSLYLSPPSRHSESAKLTGTNNTLLRACPSLMTCLWHTDCHLVSLKLTNIDCSGCENILSGWKRLGKRCKALRELHIENVSLFDDMCLENLTRQCTCIVQLALKTLPGVQGIYLEGLAETCSQLEVLNVSQKYNLAFHALLDHRYYTS